MGTWGSMQDHSASERSVWYALLIMPGILPGHRIRTPFQTVSKLSDSRYLVHSPFLQPIWKRLISLHVEKLPVSACAAKS
jgi:hypothetical protein